MISRLEEIRRQQRGVKKLECGRYRVRFYAYGRDFIRTVQAESFEEAQAIRQRLAAEVRRTSANAAGIEEFVYWISDGQFVKLGFSTDPLSRVDDLQVGSSVPLKLVRVAPGSRTTERRLHRLASVGSVGGEWFTEEAARTAWDAVVGDGGFEVDHG